VFAAITARILSRNVTLLYEFAHRAAAGEPMIAEKEFPHDMLGDISRQIFKLYTEKDAAMARSEYDHAAAIKATEDKVRSTRELSNNINHELKTPVGVIRGYLDTIAEHPEMPPETQKRFIDNARQAMERLCNLLNDLSSITRLEEGGASIIREPVVINDLLYNMSAEIKSTEILKHITFSYDVPEECTVMSNYSLLYGMLMNLIVNADFHSRGDSCELKLLGEVDHRFYSFSFADNGVGVSEEHIPHLFERFYRIDKGRSRKVGGTGLGLPIVKNTVTVFGGDITVRNRTPHGLEFIFTLPIAQ
jgi:signal transduction histidine kinase